MIYNPFKLLSYKTRIIIHILLDLNKISNVISFNSIINIFKDYKIINNFEKTFPLAIIPFY